MPQLIKVTWDLAGGPPSPSLTVMGQPHAPPQQGSLTPPVQQAVSMPASHWQSSRAQLHCPAVLAGSPPLLWGSAAVVQQLS
jgi:hypothetical protein